MLKAQAERLMFIIFAFIILALSVGASMINRALQMPTFEPILEKASFWLMIASAALFAMVILGYLLSHRIYRGFRYFWHYRSVKSSLEHQMIDGGFGIQRSYYIELPKIKLSFNKDFMSGTLIVKDSIKFDNKLDNAAISAALGKFYVERKYQTDDGNFWIYEFLDGSISFKQTFNSFGDFLKYSNTIPPYTLFLDRRSAVKLQHSLVVGLTGSGKTYKIYNFLLQMLNKNVRYELFFADPKGSSLAVIGSIIAEDRTAVDINSIVQLLDEFVCLMWARKNELRERLKVKVDADYSDFGMNPCVFIFDEYASYASTLASKEKAVRDKAKALLYEIILQGRQLGFFVMLIMQKSDATLIDTAIRDNIPLKIVLGNSEQQTYVTAFGAGIDIPNRHYLVGEGVFTEPILAPTPKLLQAPYFGFDILQALHHSPRGVTTGAPKK